MKKGVLLCFFMVFFNLVVAHAAEPLADVSLCISVLRGFAEDNLIARHIEALQHPNVENPSLVTPDIGVFEAMYSVMGKPPEGYRWYPFEQFFPALNQEDWPALLIGRVIAGANHSVSLTRRWMPPTSGDMLPYHRDFFAGRVSSVTSLDSGAQEIAGYRMQLDLPDGTTKEIPLLLPPDSERYLGPVLFLLGRIPYNTVAGLQIGRERPSLDLLLAAEKIFGGSLRELDLDVIIAILTLIKDFPPVYENTEFVSILKGRYDFFLTRNEYGLAETDRRFTDDLLKSLIDLVYKFLQENKILDFSEAVAGASDYFRRVVRDNRRFETLIDDVIKIRGLLIQRPAKN